MEHIDHLLPFPRAVSFFQAVQDEDCFTILWELAEYSPKPIPFETIRKTFGAEPRYLIEILDRLRRLGIARKTGRHWTVYDWAKISLEYLEEMTQDAQIEVAEAASFGTGIYASDALEGATQNGFWVGIASQVTAGDSIVVGNPHTATANDGTELKSSELTEKPRNEARSHDYK